MNKLYRYIILGLVVAFVACDTDVETIGYNSQVNVDYAALRAYRETDHELAFGWLGGWTGGGISAAGALSGLPDSMDLVSLWGWSSKVVQTPQMIKDLKYVQEVKGMKVFACVFAPRIGQDFTPEGVTREEYWGWSNTDRDMQEAATRKYADTVAAKVLKDGYDGIEIDNETEKGNIYGDQRLFCAFVSQLGKYMGPKSGTDKMLCVDGWLTHGMTDTMDLYLDYFISQAYYCTSYSNLDSRFNDVVKFFKKTPAEELAKKFIVTEDFERGSSVGGSSFIDRAGNRMPSSLGMAGWRPQKDGVDIPKGGFGMYHIENDYVNPMMPYYYTRHGIQIQNPAKKQ